MTPRWNLFRVTLTETPVGTFETETLVAVGLDREAAIRLATNMGRGVRLREDVGSVRVDEDGFRERVLP